MNYRIDLLLNVYYYKMRMLEFLMFIIYKSFKIFFVGFYYVDFIFLYVLEFW